MLSSFAFAGDCGGPDDCTAPRDNAVKAAGGAAVATGIALVLRGNGDDGQDEEEDKDEEKGEADATDVNKALGGDDTEPKIAEEKGEGEGSSDVTI